MGDRKWRGVLVLLAPTLIGLLGFAVAASGLVALNARVWMWVIADYALVVWLLTCPGDVYSAWRLITRGRAADYSSARRDGYLFWLDWLCHIKNDK